MTEIERLQKAERDATAKVVGYARCIARLMRERADVGRLAAEMFLDAVEAQQQAQEAVMRAILDDALAPLSRRAQP